MLRTAKPSDLSRIMNLLHQVNDVHAEGRPDLFVKGHTKYSEEEALQIIANPATPVFVLSDDDDILMAYCFCKIQDHTSDAHLAPVKTLYIDDLCVDEKARGQHLGSRLYAYVKDWAKQKAFHNITLNVWAENTSAIRFYESLGLRPYKFAMEQRL